MKQRLRIWVKSTASTKHNHDNSVNRVWNSCSVISLVFSKLSNNWLPIEYHIHHYDDLIMGAMGSQITGLTIVYSTVYSGADQRKHQCSASLAFVRGIHREAVNSPHKWPVTRKCLHLMNRYPFPFLHIYQRFKYPLTYYILYLLVAQWRSENMWLFPVALMVAAL